MVLKKIKILIVGLAVLISMNAEAKVEQFQDSFTGYLGKQIENASGWYTGESIFTSGNVNLQTSYDLYDFNPDFYIVSGTFVRSDSTSAFSGIFDFSVIYPDPGSIQDPWLVAYPISGFLQYDNSIYSPITGELLIADRGFGEIKGFIGQQDYVSFTIDWTIHTGAAVSSVPEPQTAWMLCIGLVALGGMRGKRISPKLSHHSLK